jgi:CubicO group peptidase (beta-lactamase class C family)
MLTLDRFVAAAEDLRVLSIVVYQHGKRVAEHHWEPEARRIQYSATKSFTSTAVGIAVKEGLLSLDERVADCFSADIPADPSSHLRAMTVRDLLTMCMGHDAGYLMAEQRPTMPETDWVRYALALPLPDAPGTRFMYDNCGPYLAGILVQRRAGCDLVDYLMPRLFAPLGIQTPTWETDLQRRSFGASGLFITVSELAKLGVLYLQDGVWNGRQIITREWAREATRKQVENAGPDVVNADNVCGYGYLFWMGRHSTFRADGKYGQFAIVSREKDAVIAINSESREAQRILDAVWEHVLPAL